LIALNDAHRRPQHQRGSIRSRLDLLWQTGELSRIVASLLPAIASSPSPVSTLVCSKATATECSVAVAFFWSHRFEFARIPPDRAEERIFEPGILLSYTASQVESGLPGLSAPSEMPAARHITADPSNDPLPPELPPQYHRVGHDSLFVVISVISTWMRRAAAVRASAAAARDHLPILPSRSSRFSIRLTLTRLPAPL